MADEENSFETRLNNVLDLDGSDLDEDLKTENVSAPKTDNRAVTRTVSNTESLRVVSDRKGFRTLISSSNKKKSESKLILVCRRVL